MKLKGVWIIITILFLLTSCSSWNKVRIAGDEYKVYVVPIDGSTPLKPSYEEEPSITKNSLMNSVKPN